MIFQSLKWILPLVVIGVVSACDKGPVFDKNGNFRNRDAGPDEFAVVPSKELVLPESFEALPEPTLGSKSLADVEPRKDAIAALGGNPDSLDSNLIGGGEQAVISAASRYGVEPDVRAQLAAEDAKEARKKRPILIQKWFKAHHYLRSRADQSLDAYEELENLRSKGVRTPTAPPQ